MTDREWIIETFLSYLVIKDPPPIDRWVDSGALMLPSNTAEPGLYSLARTPYQRRILQVLSPHDPTQRVILCTGAQIGKTTVELALMGYFIEEMPSPMGFVFSDEMNLKNFIKYKFDPFTAANPAIRSLLRSEGRTSGNSLTSKQFPGGFLKLASGRSDSSARSDSLRVLIFDELDAVAASGEGDPVTRFEKRTNTFGDSRKICLSSTPTNASTIYPALQASSFQKYYMRCPHCGEYMTFELDYLKWTVDAGSNVTDAWMECPRCGGRIDNDDKLSMMAVENGAEWRATNPNPAPLTEGFFLPSFYAPVGWSPSWREIAHDYVQAGFTEKGLDNDRMTTFYNTILALPYTPGSNARDWRLKYDEALASPYRRGDVPAWVNIITTGSDVQADRIETTVMGWGFRGRNIVIDHIVFPVPDDERISMLDGTVWKLYTDTILGGTWEREDGLILRSIGNGLDRSYESDTIDAFYIMTPLELRESLFPIRGDDRMQGVIARKTNVKKEGLSRARYWNTPVSEIKKQVYDHLEGEDNEEHTKAYIAFFPADFDSEFFQQLYSETLERIGRRYAWKKKRDRNEILDCRVYNYAVFNLLGLAMQSDADWKALGDAQRLSNAARRKGKRIIKGHTRRLISKGLEI